MDKIWDRKSEVIGHCGENEKKRMTKVERRLKKRAKKKALRSLLHSPIDMLLPLLELLTDVV